MTKMLSEDELSEIENQYAEFSKVVGDLITTIRAKDVLIKRLKTLENVAIAAKNFMTTEPRGLADWEWLKDEVEALGDTP